MNVEHLKAVLDAIVADNREIQLDSIVNAVSDAYSQTLQDPTADTALNFTEVRENLRQAVQKGRCFRLTPSAVAILERLGAVDLCGVGLLGKVDAVVDSNKTPAEKVSQLQDLQQQVGQFTQTATAMCDAMTAVNIKATLIPKDQAEVEVLIPSTLIDDSLGGLAIEAKKLDAALRNVVECASGSRPDLKIRSVASGSVEIFLVVDLVSGAQILILISSILALINTILNLRMSRDAYAQAGIPEDVLVRLKALEDEKRDETLEQLANELSAKIQDEHRRNEIDDSVRRSVRYIADRIDRGMNVDVAILPEAAPMEEPPQQNGGEADVLAQAKWNIAQSMKERRRINRHAEPVLALPFPQANEEADEEGEATT